MSASAGACAGRALAVPVLSRQRSAVQRRRQQHGRPDVRKGDSAFATQNGAFATQNGAFATQNGAFATQNGAFATQRERVLRFVFFRIASLYSCTHDTLRSISALSSITSTLTPTCVPRATAAHKRRATRVRKHCCSYSPSAIYTKETLQANLTCSFSRAERYGSNPNCTQVRYI